LSNLEQLLLNQRWEILKTEERSTLIEERIRNEGGDVWTAYQTAVSRGFWIKIFPDHFASGKRKIMITGPRIGEAFVDKIINRAGGRRLTAEERNNEKTRNADYIIGNYLIELKDIQKEGLEKTARQTKLADLFKRYYPHDQEIIIDPSILSESDLQKYADIVGGPISSQIKSASEQLRLSKAHLGRSDIIGGIIVLNSGYFSLSPNVFFELVSKFSRKNSSQIHLVICICPRFATDGFNSWIAFQFFPTTFQNDIEKRIAEAFSKECDAFMNEWVRSGIKHPDINAPIVTPITFRRNGRTFSYFPKDLPKRWTPESMKSIKG